MKQFLSEGFKKGIRRESPTPQRTMLRRRRGSSRRRRTALIFGGTAAYDSKRCQKLARHEVYAAEPATPAFLRWSRSPISFDRSDHPESVLHQGRYLLVVDPIIEMKRLTKVLMDGGSGLNIMYAETLDAMGIDQSRIRPTRVPFHGIIPGK
jgi:hypothetical protein